MAAVGSGVLCALLAGAYNEGQLPLQKSPKTVIKRVGVWCEMASFLGVSQSFSQFE
jgi:hypothetical protein